ncbi:MAG: site-2 protease family protein [Bryobacter sp.]|nr:site-2 protease family protein [Bryobacter sp.]
MLIQSQPRRHKFVPALLFALTLITTSSAGHRFFFNFHNGLPAVRIEEDFLPLLQGLLQPSAWLAGLSFSLPLLLILLAHELGHYCTCLYYNLNATLPYFLPAPTFIGTFGAFIRIRDIIYNRRVLFDVALGGPLAGLVVTLPFLFFGLWLSRWDPALAPQGDLIFTQPPLMRLFSLFFFPTAPPEQIYLHPMARGAWVGLFATALNLLPIGQLDGGHIVYAASPRWARAITHLAIAALVPLGLLYYLPWLGWAALLFFFGRRHPRIEDPTPLNSARLLLAALALLLFALCFSPAPLRYG